MSNHFKFEIKVHLVGVYSTYSIWNHERQKKPRNSAVFIFWVQSQVFHSPLLVSRPVSSGMSSTAAVSAEQPDLQAATAVSPFQRRAARSVSRAEASGQRGQELHTDFLLQWQRDSVAVWGGFPHHLNRYIFLLLCCFLKKNKTWKPLSLPPDSFVLPPGKKKKSIFGS